MNIVPLGRSEGGYSTHELGFQEAHQAGPARIEPIQAACQSERQSWPILHQDAYAQARHQAAVRRTVAFPITVAADKKQTLRRPGPGGIHVSASRFSALGAGLISGPRPAPEGYGSPSEFLGDLLADRVQHARGHPSSDPLFGLTRQLGQARCRVGLGDVEPIHRLGET